MMKNPDGKGGESDSGSGRGGRSRPQQRKKNGKHPSRRKNMRGDDDTLVTESDTLKSIGQPLGLDSASQGAASSWALSGRPRSDRSVFRHRSSQS